MLTESSATKKVKRSTSTVRRTNGYPAFIRIIQNDDADTFDQNWIKTRQCPLWHPSMFKWICQELRQFSSIHMKNLLQTYLPSIHYDRNDIIPLLSTKDLIRTIFVFNNRHIRQWTICCPDDLDLACCPFLPTIQHIYFSFPSKWTLSHLQQLQSRCPSVSHLTLCFDRNQHYIYPFTDWVQHQIMDLQINHIPDSILSSQPFHSFSHLETLILDSPLSNDDDDHSWWNQIQWPPQLRQLRLLHMDLSNDFQLNLRSLHLLHLFELQSDSFHETFNYFTPLFQCLLPNQLQKLMYRTRYFASYHNRYDSHLFQTIQWPTALISLDLSAVCLERDCLLSLFQLPHQWTSLALCIDPTALHPLIQEQWRTFAIRACSSLHSFKLECRAIESWWVQDWLPSLPSLTQLVMVTRQNVSELYWIQCFQQTHLHSFHCETPPVGLSCAFFEALVHTSIAHFKMSERLIDSFIRILLSSRHLLHVQGSPYYERVRRMSKQRRRLEWHCIQNQVHLDAWKRICFLLAWMRANANNPIQDSGLDWVRSCYWEKPCNLLSQFMRNELPDSF